LIAVAAGATENYCDHRSSRRALSKQNSEFAFND